MVDPCTTTTMAVSPYLSAGERKHWWLTNKKVLIFFLFSGTGPVFHWCDVVFFFV